jgi:hypothetical protein
MTKTKQVLVLQPAVVNGKHYDWGKSHTLDCHVPKTWTGVVVPYTRISASKVPSHVERCKFCGGGR